MSTRLNEAVSRCLHGFDDDDDDDDDDDNEGVSD